MAGLGSSVSHCTTGPHRVCRNLHRLSGLEPSQARQRTSLRRTLATEQSELSSMITANMVFAGKLIASLAAEIGRSANARNDWIREPEAVVVPASRAISPGRLRCSNGKWGRRTKSSARTRHYPPLLRGRRRAQNWPWRRSTIGRDGGVVHSCSSRGVANGGATRRGSTGFGSTRPGTSAADHTVNILQLCVETGKYDPTFGACQARHGHASRDPPRVRQNSVEFKGQAIDSVEQS